MLVFRFLPVLGLLACAEAPSSGIIPGGAPASSEIAPIADARLSPADLPPNTRELRFGVTPYLDLASLRAQFTPIARYVGSRLGVTVTVVTATTYDALIDLVVKGEVDIAALSPLSYVVARERAPDLRLVASELTSGSIHFSSLVLVRDDDPAQTLSELRGRRIGFVDERSTTGFLYPYDAFLTAGLDPERDFASVSLLRTHPAAVRSLMEGRVDAACVASGMFEVARDSAGASGRTLLDPTRVRVLANVGRVRYDSLVVRGAIPASGAAKIASVFGGLSRRTAEGRAVLAAAVRIAGWVAAADAHYSPIREVRARVDTHRAAK